MVVGGTATASNSAIVGNSVTVEGGYVGQGAVGGLAQTSHTGSLKNNTYTTSRGTMLTLTDGFDGQTVDWNKVNIDTSKLSNDKTVGAITLMKSGGTTKKLKFSNYAAKNHAVSGDYEVVQRTDTNTGEASSVLIDVNRFRNGAVVYDGVNPNAKTYAGVSYGGNTAEKNIMTLTGIASGNTVDYLSGGRSEGTAGGSTVNKVTITGTDHRDGSETKTGTIENVYGGFIGNAANNGAATDNEVTISGGKVGTVHGGGHGQHREPCGRHDRRHGLRRAHARFGGCAHGQHAACERFCDSRADCKLCKCEIYREQGHGR